MGTNCAPLLADLFLYPYEAEFIQKHVREKYHSQRFTQHSGISTAYYQLTIATSVQLCT